jgi:hypothetical protein
VRSSASRSLLNCGHTRAAVDSDMAREQIRVNNIQKLEDEDEERKKKVRVIDDGRSATRKFRTTSLASPQNAAHSPRRLSEFLETYLRASKQCKGCEAHSLFLFATMAIDYSHFISDRARAYKPSASQFLPFCFSTWGI